MELPELEPLEPELEPEPMLPLLDPLVDGVLGEVVELGEVLLLPLAPVPALEPLLLGELEELGELELGDVLLPLAPELEPDLLKCASHSWREIWPSLFVSTDEKLGLEELELVEPPDAALPPEDDAPEEGVLELEPLEPDAAGDEDELEDDGLLLELEPVEPEAAGADDDDDLSAPLVLLEELCASVAPDSANSAAAVAALRTLSLNIGDTSLQGK